MSERRWPSPVSTVCFIDIFEFTVAHTREAPWPIVIRRCSLILFRIPTTNDVPLDTINHSQIMRGIVHKYRMKYRWGIRKYLGVLGPMSGVRRRPG
jgi:hypothetical protein